MRPGGGETAANVARYAQRGRARARAAGRLPPPRLLGRRRRAPPWRLHGGDFDSASGCPRPTTRPSSRPSGSCASRPHVPWRIYRPSDRGRRLAKRRDGQDRRPLLLLPRDRAHAPAAARVGSAGRPRLGYTNIVPVDCVADAIDHIAHQPGPRRAHIPPDHPRPQRIDELLNGSPRPRTRHACAQRTESASSTRCRSGRLRLALALPPCAGSGRASARPRASPRAVRHLTFDCRFDSSGPAALAGTVDRLPR